MEKQLGDALTDLENFGLKIGSIVSQDVTGQVPVLPGTIQPVNTNTLLLIGAGLVALLIFSGRRP